MKKCKLVAGLLSAFMTVGVLCSCGGGGGTTSTGGNSASNPTSESVSTQETTSVKESTGGENKTLKISASNFGYGVEWLYALKDAYEAKNPNVKIDVSDVRVGEMGNNAFLQMLDSHTGDTDLFFIKDGDYYHTVYQGGFSQKGVAYDCLFEDLTDVWTATLSDGSTLEQKSVPAVKENLKMGDKYYAVNWADGFMGVVRNKTAWEMLGLTDDDIPVTTGELFALCDRINGAEVNKNKDDYDDIAPFIFSKDVEYYHCVYEIWFSQAEGVEGFTNYVNGIGADGGQDPETEKYVYDYEGHTKALEFMQTLLKKDNKKYVYQHRDSEELGFTDMQSYFLDANAAVFCINGSWLESEQNKSGGKERNIDYIKAPVLSSLIEKLSVNALEKTPEEKEEILGRIVRFVDAHPENGDNEGKPEEATDADVEIIRSARMSSYTRSTFDHLGLIPAVAKNKDTAKDFLKFMYSDEGINIYYKAQKGLTLPATPTTPYEEIHLSTFTKSVNEAIASGAMVSFTRKAKLYCLGGLAMECSNLTGGFVQAFDEGKTIEYILQANRSYIADHWSTIVKAIR